MLPFQSWKALLTSAPSWAYWASVWAAVPERRGGWWKTGRPSGVRKGTLLDQGVPGDSVWCSAAGGEGSLRRGLGAAFENNGFQFCAWNTATSLFLKTDYTAPICSLNQSFPRQVPPIPLNSGLMVQWRMWKGFAYAWITHGALKQTLRLGI